MKKTPTPEVLAAVEELKKQCAKAEAKGNNKTAHHETLAAYEKEYDLKAKKETDNGK